MTISGAQELDCSAGFGVLHAGSGQAVKGLMAGITPGLYAAPQAEGRLVAQLHPERQADCPIRMK